MTENETEKSKEPEGPKSRLAEIAQSAEKPTRENHLWKAFLAGPSGSGKTQSALTLPGSKLLIDFDGRSSTAAGYPNVKVIKCLELDPRDPKAWDRAESFRKQINLEIRQRVFPFDGVIYDGLTSLGRMSMNWALTLDPKRGLGGGPAKHHYGPQMDNLAKYVISSLVPEIHVVWTDHMELIEVESQGTIKWLPKITGKLRTEVGNWFNETFLCSRSRNPKDPSDLWYFWQTKGSGRMDFFKSSLNNLGSLWKDPVRIDFNRSSVGFEALEEIAFGKEE